MMSRPLPHTHAAEAQTAPTDAQTDAQTAQPAFPTAPTDAQTAAPTDVQAAQTAFPTTPTDAQTDAPTAQTAKASVSSDWYTDTLRTIVSRALNADKPDIKGALAALQLLAETECDPEQESDIAHILRDARRRVIDGKQSRP